jgi:hypothetical protein
MVSVMPALLKLAAFGPDDQRRTSRLTRSRNAASERQERRALSREIFSRSAAGDVSARVTFRKRRFIANKII